jgi:RNA polymerase sigma-70 factor (ECF subfamily)
MSLAVRVPAHRSPRRFPETPAPGRIIVARMRTRPDASTEAPDVALLAAYADGDQSAARTLTARHAPRVFALARRMLGETAEAEDVAQEAMLRLWRIAPDWEAGRAEISTWLYRVASNLCIDRLRRRRELGSDAVPEIADEAPGAVRRLEERDRTRALAGAMAALPDRQRLALVLRHFDERPNPEIAEILGISVEAVESLLSRGRRALAAELLPQRAELGYGDG